MKTAPEVAQTLKRCFGGAVSGAFCGHWCGRVTSSAVREDAAGVLDETFLGEMLVAEELLHPLPEPPALH
jgi:hypothetical protein